MVLVFVVVVLQPDYLLVQHYLDQFQLVKTMLKLQADLDP
jgi:hypothetical protein